MNKFQTIISNYDCRLGHDVEVHRAIEIYDSKTYKAILDLCEENNVKIFSETFTITDKLLQRYAPVYKIYESIDIIGKKYYSVNYNKGDIFYKIYDYNDHLKEYKKRLRLTSIRNLKLYRVKRAEKFIQYMTTSYFKLNKGAK